MNTPTPHKSEHSRRLDPELQAILDSENAPALRPLTLAFLVVVFIWFVLGFLPWIAQEGAPWTLTWGLPGKASQFADSFGFINSLFSALAFAGVIMAILLQRQELAEQRKELIITQWELKKSADAQQDSQRHLARQAEVSLNSSLLSALDGIQKLAEIQYALPEASGELQARFTFNLVNKWRYHVLSRILPLADDDDSNSWLQGELNLWLALMFIHTECSKLAGMARSAIVPTSDGAFTNDGRQSETLDREALKKFVSYFETVYNRLSKGLSITGESSDFFANWKVFSEFVREECQDEWNFIHQIKNFAQSARTMSQQAEAKLTAMAESMPSGM